LLVLIFAVTDDQALQVSNQRFAIRDSALTKQLYEPCDLVARGLSQALHSAMLKRILLDQGRIELVPADELAQLVAQWDR
jgi:hypothetical protein